MYRKIITMTAYKRPDYTKQVIDNLKNCIGFQDYTLLARIEPGYPEVERIFRDIPNCELIINDGPPGCGINTLKVLDEGFRRSDFIIHLEDDILPGIDSLKYFEYINKRYKDDKSIFTATAFNRISEKGVKKLGLNDYFSMSRCPGFTGWMWATWSDRWKEISEKWVSNDPPGWDWNIERTIRNKRYEICPVVPRSLNIGRRESLHATENVWRNCQQSDYWINNLPDFPDLLQTRLLQPNISNLYDNINIRELPYFESTSMTCPPICNYTEIPTTVIVVVGIGILYLIRPRSRPISRPRIIG